MIQAGYNDRDKVVSILASSFYDNKSVNYIVKQDHKKLQRIKKLMEYSFDLCLMFGRVFLSDNKEACALVLLPDRKKPTVRSALLDLKLIFFATGVGNIDKAIKRENAIAKHHPEGPIYYLWFIGVDQPSQNQGIGSRLMQELINDGLSQNRVVCLETSTLRNIPWYKKFGFTIYHELDFGYRLYCMKKE